MRNNRPCDRVKLTEQGMTRPPDLVIEIVSPDSRLIDRRRRVRRVGVTLKVVQKGP